MAATPLALERVRKYCAAQMDETGVVRLPRSMSELAGRLHMSRSTLYRCIDQLERDGALQRRGKELDIFEPLDGKEGSEKLCE